MKNILFFSALCFIPLMLSAQKGKSKTIYSIERTDDVLILKSNQDSNKFIFKTKFNKGSTLLIGENGETCVVSKKGACSIENPMMKIVMDPKKSAIFIKGLGGCEWVNYSGDCENEKCNYWVSNEKISTKPL